jgi:uncharacterized membrane protein/osmotically-inducible protein OsmY
MQKRWLIPVSTGLLGAGLMYFFDPQRGRRRRRQLDKQLAQAGHNIQSGFDKTRHGIQQAGHSVQSGLNKTGHGIQQVAHTVQSGFNKTGRNLRKARKLANGALPSRPIFSRFHVSRHNPKFSNQARARFERSVSWYSGFSARNRWLTLAGIGLLGAGVMFFFDPKRGVRRRNLLNDKAIHAGHKLQSGATRAGHDIHNRTRGALASIRKSFSFKSSDDKVLVATVRAHLGHILSHPRSIEITAQQGSVTLRGQVLSSEVEQLLRHVYSVEGVQEIHNQLEVYDEPGNIPGLQGAGILRQGKLSILRQPDWSPAVRAIGGAAGFAAMVCGARRGLIHNKWAGAATAVAGSLLLARSVTNLEFSRLTGIGARRSAINIKKSIRINAPARQVFAVWADFGNFPLFMSHVRQVRRLDDGGQEKALWRWTVDGPAGTEVEFDATVSAFESGSLLAWITEPASVIRHAGRVQFRDNPDGSTTVEVRMSYNPIAGALGHAVARFFGADPKRQMDDDLLRMKTFIETGKLPHDAAAQAPAHFVQQGAAPASTDLH